ncbi:MAG: hypothetical protein Q8P22_04560 [Chloroflexota bacterium]|nr:hypothetical protein [Chloroflexota bacterium]
MNRKLEETLAECLAALEGGRLGVEECLDLYPEVAPELEPLLRLARGLGHAYAVEPAPGFEQAARQRFVTAIARRRQGRLVPRSVGARPAWRWAPAALGSAALVAFAAWAGVLAFGGGGGGTETVLQTPEATSTPAAVVSNIDEQVARIQERLAEIQSLAEQGVAIEAPVIQQLREVTSTLVGSLGPDNVGLVAQEDVSKIGDLLASQEEILTQVKDKVAPEASADLDDTIRMAQEGQDKVEVLLAATTATATPAASPTPSPTLTPTSTPTATPEPTGTAAPTSTPTPSGSPSATEQPTSTPEASSEGFGPVPTAVP